MRMSKCLNCGAVAKTQGNDFVCEYCGTVMQPEPKQGQQQAATKGSGLGGLFSMLADKTLQIQSDFQRLYLDKVKPAVSSGINTAGAAVTKDFAPYDPEKDNIYRFKNDPLYYPLPGAQDAGAILINGLRRACVYRKPYNDFSAFADGLSRTVFMHKSVKAPAYQLNNYIANIINQYCAVFKAVAAVRPDKADNFLEWKSEASLRAVYYAAALINLLTPQALKANAANFKREFIPLFRTCVADALRITQSNGNYASEQANLNAWHEYLSGF